MSASARPVVPSVIAEAVAAVADLGKAVGQFRESVDARIGSLEKALDDVSRESTAARMGGGGSVIALPGRNSPVMKAVADFARGKINTMAVQARMSTDSNVDGGFLIPEEAERSIGATQRDLSALRRIARVQSVTQAVWKKTLWLGGAGADWATEHGARPATDTAKLAEIVIPANELYANAPLTQTVIDDARIDVAAELLGEIGKSFDEKEADAFVLGDGAKRPKGFLTYPTSTAGDKARPFGTIQHIVTGDAGGFVASSATVSPVDCLVDMVYGLKTAHRRNGRWLMSSSTAAIVRKFKDAEGRPVWEQSTQAGQPSLLLGYPVELDDYMPDVDADAFPVAFADWQEAYVIVDRIGITVLRDPFTNKPYVHFYCTKRVGGGLYNSEAIKLLKVAA